MHPARPRPRRAAWLLPLAALTTDRRLWRLAILTTGLVGVLQLVGYIPHVKVF